ncbi:MAG: signal recognition particle receptor subunit alpha [Candidatus Nanoarchaeia archaeon]|jgi:signal recognition particle subunit SRP54|nr:signal recognition particle receptor subunit alpha [Candidatus Nanoarchaeia archaeon]
MVLDKLSDSLKNALKKLTSGKVDKEAVAELCSEIKKSLISADVSIELARDIAKNIEKRALKEKVAGGLTAREHTVNIVYEELTNLLGKEFEEIPTELKPTKIMLVGLFGSGKTTTAGKLAKLYKKRGKKIALVQTDTWRPAAYAQLKQLADVLKVDFYGNAKERNPVKIYNAVKKDLEKYELVIIDTAGRDALNDELTKEIESIDKAVQAQTKLLVLSGDIGQAAQKTAESFHKAVGVTGVIVTKLDGTAKGGGALSAAAATKAKVNFIGVGEKLDAIEEFKPKNFVSRILGMGDLETLLEKAGEAIDQETAEKTAKNIMKGDISFTDLYNQMEALKKMGPLGQVTNMIPGMGKMNIPKHQLKEQEENMKIWKYLMDSMTVQEKDDPSLMNESRIQRIVKGSGRDETEMRDLIKQYKQMKKMMKSFSGQSKKFARMQKLMGKKGMPKMPGMF